MFVFPTYSHMIESVDWEDGNTGVRGWKSIVEGVGNGDGGDGERWLKGRRTRSETYGIRGLWFGTIIRG